MTNHRGEEIRFSNDVKILIAEDERDLAEMLAYNLEKKGYRTSRAYDGLEAWDRIEIDDPDLLILDLMMPKMDGWELCRLIRQHAREKVREMSILMLTARSGENGVVEISVKDTGIGIYREDMERIFEPFSRGRNAGTEEGVGLGLSLVKEVAASHGGKILVESEPQKGSTFSILLPVEDKVKGKEVGGELTKM